MSGLTCEQCGRRFRSTVDYHAHQNDLGMCAAVGERAEDIGMGLVVRALSEALAYYEARDRMNARVHLEPPRWSPITVLTRKGLERAILSKPLLDAVAQAGLSLADVKTALAGAGDPTPLRSDHRISLTEQSGPAPEDGGPEPTTQTAVAAEEQ